METSRSINSIKNMLFGLGGQLTSMLMGFVTRWVFIVLLGREYLGVSGLFSNVLSLLSLANLGFDTAIVYSLYKPLAEGDFVSVKGYMQLYRKVYSGVGVVVFTLGCALIPFLPSLINGEVTIPENLYLIYLLFLLQSSVSYFFSYKQALLTASQQNRVISLYHTVFMVVRNVLEIAMLLLFRAYVPTLILIVVCQIAENIWIAHITDRRFPVLENSEIAGDLTRKQKAELSGSVRALLLYKVSGTVISSTDNILISKFQGLISVGLYSNYAYIVDVIRTFLSYIFYSLTASVGNYSVSESKEKNKSMFYLLFFASFWLYGFTGTCLGVLLNPFIELWLGVEYVLSKWTVFVIVVNYYTAGLQYASTTYREVTGLFRVGKYRPLIAAVLNLGISILLAKPLGIAGVLLGTILSRFLVYFWYDPYIIHKVLFESKLSNYFKRYGVYATVTLFVAIGCDFVSDCVSVRNDVVDFVFSMMICAIVPNLLFVLIFRKTQEFSVLVNYAVSLFERGALAKLRLRKMTAPSQSDSQTAEVRHIDR